MKSNHSTRWIVKARVVLLVLVLAAIVGIEFGVGESLASRIGQITATRSEAPQAPSVGLSDLMAAAR